MTSKAKILRKGIRKVFIGLFFNNVNPQTFSRSAFIASLKEVQHRKGMVAKFVKVFRMSEWFVLRWNTVLKFGYSKSVVSIYEHLDNSLKRLKPSAKTAASTAQNRDILKKTVAWIWNQAAFVSSHIENASRSENHKYDKKAQ